jgi:CubicO group peptidase (beta-lactamase class C family)
MARYTQTELNVLHAVNPFVAALLHLPLHRLLGRGFGKTMGAEAWGRLAPHAATIVILALLGCQARDPQVGQAPTVTTPPVATPIVAEPDYWPTSGWRSSTPEQQGVDSARLAAMFDAIEREQLHLHSVLFVRNGYVVTEAYFAPYSPTVKQQVMSVTKSVVGMLTGIAINQGRIEGVDQPVLAFFPDRTVANLDQNKRRLRLEHLLNQTAGLECSDDAGARERMFQSPDWVQFALDLPMAAEPGTQFSYCSPAVHLMSPVLSQATSRSLSELANEELFAPLGIPAAGLADWSTDPQGLPQGFSGLALTPRNMAKLGLLYLQGGRWNGHQVVPASWVAASLAPHTADATGRGYGYLFWIDGDRGYYSALGLGGQDIHIIPAKNLVVVVTAAIDGPTNDQKVLKLIDDYVVPAAASGQALPDDPAAVQQLQARIERAASPQVPPPPLPALARSVSGKVYRMEVDPNGWTTISLTLREGSAEAEATINGSEPLLIGLDNVPRTTWDGDVGHAARGRWEGEDTFVVEDHVLGDFRQWQYRLTFEGDRLRVDGWEQVTGATIAATGRRAP